MIRDELSKVYYLRLELQRLRDKLNEQQSTADGVKSGMGGGGGGNKGYVTSKIEYTVGEIISTEERLKLTELRYNEAVRRALEILKQVERPEARIILERKYMDYQSWYSIAEDMHFSGRRVIGIAKETLDRLERKWKTK